MTAQLSFKLKDHYTIKIWNPAILGDNKIKSVNGEYFFSVLYSVYRETSTENNKIATHAKKILEKFSMDISCYEKDVVSLIKMAELKKAESFFSITFPSSNVEDITFEPSERGGVCPENAAFLRSFIKFDEYIALLNEILAMTILTEKEYYIQRKMAQAKIRGIMDGYSNLIKRFHLERKKLQTKLDSVA